MAEKSPSPVTSPTPDIFADPSPPSKPDDKWPTLSSTSTPASTIQPAQKVPPAPASWTVQISKKDPINCRRMREKYEKYFQGNRILPIPELVKEVQPKIVSFVITDLKSRRLAGIRKETFEDLLRAADIPAKYYCRRSFATWDVLLPNEELATKLAGGNITLKYFRLQPEYMGKRKIKITVCNVPIQLNKEVLAAYLSGYGDIEEAVKAKSANGTAHGDYIFTMCLDRGGFMAIPHTLDYESQVMTVVVEGRKPQCWNCKQLGHFSKSCPQKTTKTTTLMATTTTTIAAAAAATTVSSGENPKPGTKDHSDKDEERWTQVVRGGKKKTSPQKLPTTTTTSTVPKPTTATTVTTVTTATTSTAKSSSSATAKKNKENNKVETMDYSTNLKRRRDSGDSVAEEGEKKHIKKPSQKPTDETGTHSQTPSQPQPKGKEKSKSPVPAERPAQIIPPPQKQKTTPVHPTEIPPSPSLSPITTPKVLVRSHSVTRLSPPPQAIAHKTRSHSTSTETRNALNAIYFCEDVLDNPNLDHSIKKSKKPLSSLKKINEKDITNPYLFSNVPMLTTFVRSAGNRTKELWHFIDEASRADVMLADTKNVMIKKMLPFCSGRVPILVHQSFYRSLKLRYPMDVGGRRSVKVPRSVHRFCQGPGLVTAAFES